MKIKKQLKKKTYCPLCGGKSPNIYGECLCSYEVVMLSGDWKKIAKRLVQVIKVIRMGSWLFYPPSSGEDNN